MLMPNVRMAGPRARETGRRRGGVSAAGPRRAQAGSRAWAPAWAAPPYMQDAAIDVVMRALPPAFRRRAARPTVREAPAGGDARHPLAGVVLGEQAVQVLSAVRQRPPPLLRRRRLLLGGCRRIKGGRLASASRRAAAVAVAMLLLLLVLLQGWRVQVALLLQCLHDTLQQRLAASPCRCWRRCWRLWCRCCGRLGLAWRLLPAAAGCGQQLAAVRSPQGRLSAESVGEVVVVGRATVQFVAGGRRACAAVEHCDVAGVAAGRAHSLGRSLPCLCPTGPRGYRVCGSSTQRGP